MKDPERIIRSRVFYFFLFLFFAVLLGYLFIALNSLLLPVLMGTLAAYISQPIINYLRKSGIPKSVAILILLGLFGFLVFVIGQRIASVVPSEKQMLELRVQIQYKINQNFLSLLGKNNFNSKGNVLDDLVGDELIPPIESINLFLMLDNNEEAKFLSYVKNSQISNRVKYFYDENKKLPFKQSKLSDAGNTKVEQLIPSIPTLKSNSKIALFFSAISKWIIMPFVFIFVLIDEGEIKKFILNIVPNRYFEMTFTTLAKVDTAIGNYLRGTILQSSLVGLTIFIGLVLVGFKLQAAILIGIIAGISNAIPFLGPIIGLGAGVIYAMIVEGINPVIPFLPANPIVGVLIVVAAAQLLDNAVFQPLVLGKAVNLHPLVVVIGVTGGSIIAGFWGMLLAIPTIAVFKVIISNVYKQAKAYYIIY